MGPPPPPPPPPPCLPAAILPSGGWKTTQTPRRDNNTVSAASKQVRPTVDSAALQHAAARLRKTGYHEQIRGDVSNLSDGRVAGENQRLPNGNRTYGSQFNQLGSDTSREPIHASPAYSVHADPVRVVRGCANPRINIQTTATPQPPAAHDLTSKNPYQTINKPFSESYIENRFESSDITRTRSPLPFTSTAQTQPHYRNVSPPQPYAPPHYENQPYTPFRNENDTYTLRTRSPPRSQPLSQYSPSDNYNYRTFTKETSRKEQHTTSPRTTELEWTTPYHPPSDHSPILDPHARIRDYATSHYVEEEPASHDYTRSVRRETNTRPAPQDFATSIRDHGVNGPFTNLRLSIQ
ncbi:hypothetical protein NECAME_04178 [Necator americanus]|uniref:Uncharacterized protein n=1 Tax=Necator americanus TaxID=51031 RepID=W2SZ51_NECAM|nr:hypothetical protein NECAME_04178 [Necator americanus]ETN73957.1 hypothetical protein NECAME_04178 [Necator americanus]